MCVCVCVGVCVKAYCECVYVFVSAHVCTHKQIQIKYNIYIEK